MLHTIEGEYHHLYTPVHPGRQPSARNAWIVPNPEPIIWH